MQVLSIPFTLFTFHNISYFHQELSDGTTSCTEAVQYYLAQIEANQHLNAFVHVYGEEALQRASLLDEKKKNRENCGKLFGVVISIKDVICYAGHPVSAASKMLESFTAVYNATAVQRLLDEDAIIIGSCNCDEFAMGSANEHSVYGRVKNALDENKVSGGSSGGSAVAVQAGLCMVSLGSDTGGSVRQPADFCGVVGMKPSYGTISRHGLIAYASSFDQIGILANGVEDIETVLDVISVGDNYDSTHRENSAFSPPRVQKLKKPDAFPSRISVLKNALEYPGLDPEIKLKVNGLAAELKSAGNEVAEIDFDLLPYIVPAYYVLTTAEASSNLSRYDGVRYGYRHEDKAKDLETFYTGNRTHGFGREVRKRILLGTFVLSEGYFDAYFTKAQQVRQLLVQRIEEIFNNFDFILLPTVPQTAFEAGSMQKDPLAAYLADIYTVLANLTGIPAISLPLFTHSNGMPFGVQLLAPAQKELNLLQVSEEILNRFKQY